MLVPHLWFLFQAQMSFFDTTATGRIINRFSSDVYTVDDSLPFIANILLSQVGKATAQKSCGSVQWLLVLMSARVPMASVAAFFILLSMTKSPYAVYEMRYFFGSGVFYTWYSSHYNLWTAMVCCCTSTHHIDILLCTGMATGYHFHVRIIFCPTTYLPLVNIRLHFDLVHTKKHDHKKSTMVHDTLITWFINSS